LFTALFARARCFRGDADVFSHRVWLNTTPSYIEAALAM